jgi:multidrug efflux pump subunit AcrA (membrane-fusion protein)
MSENKIITPEEKAAMLKDGTENMKDPRKKREIIKNILIIFLIVMLILTFFSNTIMNASLSEISTQTATSGKLTERIRGSGTIESNQTYEVMVDGNKVIDTVYIKAGQEVTKDMVLFTVGTGESEELTTAESELDALELEYQKLLLVVPTDYSSENQAIKNAREDLNTAIALRDKAVANESAEQAAKSQYIQNKSQLEQKTAEQTDLQTAISSIDMDDYSSANFEYTGQLAQLYSAYTSAESDYNTAYSIYGELAATEGDTSQVWEDVCEKESIRDDAKNIYDEEKENVRAELINRLSSVNSEVKSLTADISSYENSMESTSATLDELDADVQTKQRALEELIISLSKTQKENDVTSQISQLDIEAKKSEIEKQKEKVDKLKKECETTEIKSKYDGVVSSVDIKAGETTVPDTALAVIDISSEGYTVKITVDGEKTKSVKKGTSADVVNNWNNDITAVVSDIRNDTVSGSKNRILVFDITGDVDSGTSIDLSIPCGTGTYDVIVPKSAVYEDSKGKFVLTVKSKSSPLGNRYYAARVNIDVLASDESSCAVSGDISSGDYVITAASKPVSSGDQVKMAEK